MIISLSGKKQSGKDTVATLINGIILSNLYNEGINGINYKDYANENYFKVKRFAGSLKKIISAILNISLEDLESEKVKNSFLGEEWWYYGVDNTKYPYLDYKDFSEDQLKSQFGEYNLVKLTPRLFLQLLGTEGGRKVIHPDIWVNSTLSEYNSNKKWLITDTRFPNEINGIKRKAEKSIFINVVRLKTYKEWYEDLKSIMTISRIPNLFTNYTWETEKVRIEAFMERFERAECCVFTKEYYDFKNTFLHESENALNSFKDWDYQIYNDGSIGDLIDKVRKILITEKII